MIGTILAMSLTATKEMCFLCFEALENAVNKTNNHIVQSIVANPSDSTRCPLFVTWFKDEELRGCIGTFAEKPLYKGLAQFAVISGMEDTRFSPMRANELNHLKCEISLLHSFEKAKDVYDWEIGKHGISLEIDGRSATFLPEVAKEQNWDKDTTLLYLAQKGGYYRKFDEAAKKRASLERYQSSICYATWSEYQDFIRSHSEH